MALKPALFLSSAFGDGHNAAARNVRETLMAKRPGMATEFLDPFQEAYGGLFEVVRRLYLTATDRTPRLWEWCFDVLDHTPAVGWQMRLYNKAAGLLERRIQDLRPGVVVSTYPGCNHLLHYAFRKRLHRPFRLLTIVTDSVSVHSSWHSAPSDAYAVANEETAAILSGRGVPRSKIHITGFPVPLVFSKLADLPAPPPPACGPWKVLLMANFTPHLVPGWVRALLEIPEIELTVTTGNNRKLRAVLDRMAANHPRLHTLGWTPEMPALMASHHLLICKAGGATVQEALAAALPVLIARVTPGQEEGNARLVTERGAGIVAPHPRDLPGLVRQTFADNGLLYARYAAVARELGTPSASLDLADLTASMTID